jgi:hypothetical protein
MNDIRFTLRSVLLGFISMLVIGSLQAQIPLQQIVTGGTFPGEVGWELINTDNGIVYACGTPGGSAPSNNTYNVPAGNYQVRGYDSFGDGWNGANATYYVNAMQVAGPFTLAGGGFSNTCPGNSFGTIIGTFFLAAIEAFCCDEETPFEITCNENVPISIGPDGTVDLNDPDIAEQLVDDFGACTDAYTLSVSPSMATCADVGSTREVEVTMTLSCGNETSCTASIDVVDGVPPVFSKCPTDQTFSLDPGLCDIVFNYEIEATDNCASEAYFADQTGEQELALFNLTCGFAFEDVSYLRIYPAESSALVIDSVIAGVSQATQAGPLTVNVYEYNGLGLNFANFNLVGSDAVNVPAGTTVTLYTFEPFGTVSPNSQFVIETVAQSDVFGGVFVGLNPSGEEEPTYVACSQVVLGNLDALGFQNGVIQYVYGRLFDPGGVIPHTPDPNNQFQSGDALPIGGPYTFRYEACDASGNCAVCEFTVLVEEFDRPIRHLACNDNIQISLDDNCEAVVGADLILEGGPYGCYDDYIVTIQGKTNNVLGRADIGRTFTVTVTDPETGNSCWGRISVEDKLPPQLLCVDTTLSCRADISPSNTGFPVPPGAMLVNIGSAACPVYRFVGFDACSDVELTYKDWVTQGSCGSGFDRIITRNWKAVDASGNQTTCVQTIYLELGSFRDVGAPCNFDDLDLPALRCEERRDDSKDFTPHILRWFDGCVDDYLVDQEVLDSTGRRVPMDSLGWNYLESGPNAGHPSPDNIYWDRHPDFDATCRCWGPDEIIKWFGTGRPTGGECFNITMRYEDTRFELGDPTCDAGDIGCYKLLRQWTIFDWCTSQIAGHNQIIKVLDDEGPEITYPDRVNVGMDVWSCEGTWDVPAPWIVDNCSNETRYEVEVLTGDVSYNGSRWRVTGLAPGIHTAYISGYDCCGNVTVHEVELNVIDDVPPVAVCDAHTVLSLSGVGSTNQNGGFSKIFASTFDDGSFDNCGPVWFKAVRMIKGECNELNGDDDPVVPGYQEYPDDDVKFCCEDVGRTIMVRFLVFDVNPGPGPVNENLLRPNRPLFGRYTECMVEVTVQNKTAPTVVAPPTIVVSCDFWFDINSLTDPNDATFGRVVTNLADREKVKTTDVVCPEWCEPNFKFNYFPPAGLEEKCALYDPVHPEFTYEHLWGFDGYAISTCGTMPIIIVNDQRECGQGRITRTISVPGATGPVTATQTIFFVDCDKYYINDENCFDFDDEDGVIWPCDVELRECNASTGPDVTGRPEILNEDNCSLVAVKYEDWLFDVVPNACFKIIRKWTVLDWCQYDPRINLFDGRWEYEQIILVNDGLKPVFAVCEDVTFCDSTAYYEPTLGTCVGRATLVPDVEDACTPFEDLVFEYKIDAFNDGTYDFISSEYNRVVDNNPFADDESNARDASGVYPLGTHRIKWFVEDMCGNLQTCEYLFTVEDCKQPTPYCRTGIITVPMPTTGDVEVWARDLDIGSFDNCPGDLEFHFDEDGTQLGRVFTCEDLEGEAFKVFEVQIWVTDASGNKDYCTTFVEIQANGNCGNTVNGGTISGAVRKSDGSAISQADVRLYNVNNQMLRNMVTTGSGLYSFADLVKSSTYTVEPNRNDNPMNGVSTKDLVGIQRHLLGLSEFTDPYQLIAADVNNSGSISAKDLVELRKLILGIYDSFEEIDADQRSWRFVLKDGGITNPASPWDFKEVKTYEPLTQNRPNTDFVGVKIGDVDGNAAGLGNGTQARTNGALNLIAEDVRYELGDEVRIAVRSDNFDEITGYQYTLHFDAGSLSYAGVESGAIELGDLNFGLNRLSEGTLTTSWHSENGVSSDDVLYTLVFKATSTGRLSESVRLSSSVTRAEAYTVSGETRGVSMSLRSSEAGLVYELHQNQPNPFASETVIGFTLPKAMDASITIYDVTGKVLKYIEVAGEQGYNQVPVRSGDLSASGVLYYQLDTEDFTATKRMVVIK